MKKKAKEPKVCKHEPVISKIMVEFGNPNKTFLEVTCTYCGVELVAKWTEAKRPERKNR